MTKSVDRYDFSFSFLITYILEIEDNLLKKDFGNERNRFFIGAKNAITISFKMIKTSCFFSEGQHMSQFFFRKISLDYVYTALKT